MNSKKWVGVLRFYLKHQCSESIIVGRSIKMFVPCVFIYRGDHLDKLQNQPCNNYQNYLIVYLTVIKIRRELIKKVLKINIQNIGSKQQISADSDKAPALLNSLTRSCLCSEAKLHNPETINKCNTQHGIMEHTAALMHKLFYNARDGFFINKTIKTNKQTNKQNK